MSPDGRSIAYASDESGNADIWIAEAQGGSTLRLTDDPATDRNPSWYRTEARSLSSRPVPAVRQSGKCPALAVPRHWS